MPIRVIDCSNDPMNVKVVADAIDAMIAQRLAQATPQRPVVVLLGEAHTQPIHMVLQQGVVGRSTLAKRKFITGMELPHNLIAMAMKHAGVDSSYILSKLHAQDRDGRQALESALAYFGPDCAPASFDNRLQFFDAIGVVPRFIDLSMKRIGERMYLDNTCPLNGTLLRPSFSRSTVAAHLEIGMYARNDVMAERIIKAGAPLYILTCGREHLFGKKGQYKSSLHHLLTQAGCDVMAIYIDDRETSDPAQVVKPGSVIIKGLDETHFLFTAREEQYLRAVCKASNEMYIDQPFLRRAKAQNNLKPMVLKWIAQAADVKPPAALRA